jgi:large subunit ribosomal protein L9
MEVILLERIEKLGQMGDVVTVKPGFARNYLLPQKKAMRATKENRAVFAQHRAQLETVNLERKSEAEAVAAKLDGLKVVIVRQASESDQLYGSVTVRDIAQSVTEAGFTVESKQVQLARPIKTVNLHEVRVVLHPEVIVNIIANVARSDEEAELQAAGLRVGRPGDRDVDEDDDEDTVGVAMDSEAGEDSPAAAEAEAGAGETAEERAPEDGSRPEGDG